MINCINKRCNRHKSLKITNGSYYIPIHKLSFDILVQFLITENISQYSKNQRSSHELIQHPISNELKY